MATVALQGRDDMRRTFALGDDIIVAAGTCAQRFGMIKLDERFQPRCQARTHAHVALFAHVGCCQVRRLLLRYGQNALRMTQHAVVRDRQFFVREGVRRPRRGGMAQITRRVGGDVAYGLTYHGGQGHHRRGGCDRMAIITTSRHHVIVIHQARQWFELRGVMTGFAHIVGACMGSDLAYRYRAVMATGTTR